MSDVPPASPPTGSPPAPPSTPSNAAPQPSSAPAPAAGTPARAPSLPPELASAPKGTVVEGDVRAVGADGRVTVRTEQGEVRLDLGRSQAAQLLRPGAQVTIELRNTAVQPPIVLVTSKTVAASAPQAPAPQAPAPAVTTGSAAPAPTVPLAVGRIVQATVVPGPSPSATPAATPATLPQPSLSQPSLPQTALPQPALPQPTLPQAASPQATVPQVPAPQPGMAQSGPPAGTAPSIGTPAVAVPTATGAAARPNVGQPPAGAPATGAPTTGTPATPSATGTPPPATPSPTPPGAPPAAASAGAATNPTVSSTVASVAARASLPNGAVLTVRIAAVAEGAARTEPAQRATAGHVGAATGGMPARIDGQIAGLTAAGRPVVQSPVGFLALDARADLRLGTAIALDVLASRTGSIPDRSSPLPVLAREWPALDAALRALEEQVGATAARQMIEAMPRPGPQLTATLLFFMSALRGGDLRGWLGRNAVQSLEASGRGGLLSALADDFQTLQRAAEPNEAGWRSFLIPVTWDDRRPIRLLARRERRDGRDGRSGRPGTAFLVDLDLSNIGPFRLDGLVRSELLDLLIRTTTPLPGVMRRDIQALFDGTLERTGIIGRLSFRASPVMPPLPVDLDSSAAGDTTTVTV